MGVFNGNCGCSENQVDLMFKRAEQFIDEQITDRTRNLNRYWTDLFPVKPFPDGVGLVLQKVRFHGDIGPQYDGFDGWRKVQISRNAANAALCGENDGCGYKWEDVGHGMETVDYDLMQRDLRTKPICVKDIRTFWQYQQVQNLIFRNLTNITANMREQLNRNAAMMFAVKHLAMPNLPFNQADPYTLPNIPSGVELGRLSYRLLLNLYHPLGQEASEYALAQVNGMPSFGVIAHPETLHDMVYENPDLRIDLRECNETSCQLIKRYNFLEGIGPFILMPDLYAPRYNRDAAGVLSRVFPFDRNFPIEIGTRPITNPEYHTAEFELVILMTRDLFALRTRKPLSSVGGETNFDAETGLFSWKWHNPERCEDPYRRVGRYVTTGEIGVEPGDYTDIVALLVKRRPAYLGLEYWDPSITLPDGVDLEDQVLVQDCPCQTIIQVGSAVADNELTFIFDRDIGVAESETVEIELVNGSFLTGTVEELSTDGTRARISFAVAVCPEPGRYVGVRCTPTSYCSANVTQTTLGSILTGDVDVKLDQLLRATTGTVTAIMANGTTLDVTIDSVNLNTLVWRLNMTFAQYTAGGGVCALCVPTATVATCPGCDPEQFVDCVPDEEE